MWQAGASERTSSASAKLPFAHPIAANLIAPIDGSCPSPNCALAVCLKRAKYRKAFSAPEGACDWFHYCPQRPRGSLVVLFFEIDHVSISPASISDTGGGIDLNAGIYEHSLDVRQCSKIIVSLDQKSMLRTGHHPPRLSGKLNERIAAVRENGQLEVIGTERHRAEGEQAHLCRRQLREKLILLHQNRGSSEKAYSAFRTVSAILVI
jgi:hypothetical protein